MTRWSGPAVSGTENGVDFDARYAVADMPGVAFWLHGWAMETTEESWTLACDDPAHVYEPDSDDEPESDDTHNGACYLYSEPETAADTTRVRAVMVGDDHEHIVDVSDLTALPDDGYCRECGQTGCTAVRYE
jgi:hypothetical protein